MGEPGESAPHIAPPPRGRRRGTAVLVTAIAAVALAMVVGHFYRRHQKGVARRAHAERSRQAFKPALDRLDLAAHVLSIVENALPGAASQGTQRSAPGRTVPVRPTSIPHAPSSGAGLPVGSAPAATLGGYDIDKTIRVIHQIDIALERSADIDQFVGQLANEDYEGVAPDVLKNQKDTLAVLLKLHSRQVEAENQHAAWLATQQLVFRFASVVGGEVKAGPIGHVKVDAAQARKMLDEVNQKVATNDQLTQDIAELKDELLGMMLATAEVNHRYVKEWDTLCNHRDRAYLAVSEKNWSAAADAADAAIAMAPHEREAHLLKAIAMIEGAGPPVAAEKDSFITPEVGALLDRYIDEHPSSNAPAYLLRGALHRKEGNESAAKLDLDQAATYFPRQADQLFDMANPYKVRSFLRKSREGNYILELYKSTMLGAGYFSPDLQMARLHLERGRRDDARTKILDHFARRRQQKQWDFLLSDIQFCQNEFGPLFDEVLPQSSYLDLLVEPTTFHSSSELVIAVRNRSDRVLHNATLVLAVHFTDMHPADYEPIIANETKSVVAANSDTSYGNVHIEYQLYGQTKGAKEVASTRAVMVADEGVAWVDTDQRKLDDVQTALQRASSTPPPSGRTSAIDVDRIVEELRTSTAKVDAAMIRRLSDDDLIVTLPARAAVLKAIPRVHYGDRAPIAPSENTLTVDGIRMRFKNVGKLSDPARREPLSLTLDSALRSVQLVFEASGDQYRVKEVK